MLGYTAYVIEDMDYIQNTMMGQALLQFDPKAAAEPVEWLGLEVLNAYNDSTHIGYVEFIAKYKLKNKECTIHELSEFHYESGRWFYIGGEHLGNEA
jgi:SEC-C motif-containing protein